MAAAWRRQRTELSRRCGGEPARDTHRAGSAGFTLIELIVSIAIMAVVTTMTVVILTNFINVAGSTVRTGQAAEQSQVAVARLDRYLRGAISPQQAQAASGISATSACWGQASPAPVLQSKPTPSTPQSDPLYTVSASLGASLTVVAAHDFNVWFCGYLSVGTGATPRVYELILASTGSAPATGNTATYNPAKTVKPCRQVPHKPTAAAGATGGYCTLELLDWSNVTRKGATTTTGTCNPGTKQGCATLPAVVASVPGVWCDAYCQGLKGAVPEFHTTTNTSDYPTNVAVACRNVHPAAKPSTACAATATPPLLTYYQAPLTKTSKTAAVPPTLLSPSDCNGTAGCNTTMLDLSGAAQTKKGSKIATAKALQSLLSASLAQLQLSIISSSAPPNRASGLQPPGVLVSDRVYLQNLPGSAAGSSTGGGSTGGGSTGGGSSSCTYQSVLSALSPSAYWPLSDTGGTTAKPQIKDTTGHGYTGSFAKGTGEGATPGPLACATSIPGYSISGTPITAVHTQKPQAPLQDFSIVAWFRTTNPGGIMGFGNAKTGAASIYTRLLYVSSGAGGSGPCTVKGTLCWGVYKTAPHIVSSTYKVDDGLWHLAVATVCGDPGAGGPSACPTGLVGQYLWVDGNLAGYTRSSVSATGGYAPGGYWRLGEVPNSNGWTGANSNEWALNGTVGQMAVMPNVLTQSQIARIYSSSGATTLASPQTATAAKHPLLAQSSCLTSLATADQPVVDFPLNQSSGTVAEDIAPRGTVPGAQPSIAKTQAQTAQNTGRYSTTHSSKIPLFRLGQPQGGSPPLCNAAASTAAVSGGHVMVATSTSFAPGRLSVAAWVRFSSFPTKTAPATILGNGNPQCTGTGFSLDVSAKTGYFQVGTGTGSTRTQCPFTGGRSMWANSAPITTGKWYFFAATYDGKWVRTYLDGSLVGQQQHAGQLASSGAPITIGSTTMYGAMANVAVYASVLTSGQIAQQWSMGRG